MDEIVFNNSMTKTKNSLFLLHMLPTSFLNDSNMVHILRDHKSINIDLMKYGGINPMMHHGLL